MACSAQSVAKAHGSEWALSMNRKQSLEQLRLVRLPPTLTRLFYVAVSGLAVIGLATPVGQLPFSPTVLFDLWIVGFILVSFFTGITRSWLAVALLGAYLFTRIVPAIYMGAPLADFMQAYRWVLYLIAVAFAVGRAWGSVKGLVRLTWILAAAAAANSVLSVARFGFDARPSLLLENNFELALFCGLTIAVYEWCGDRRAWLVGLLGVTTLLSGSRSGAISFLVLVVFAVVRARVISIFYRYMLVLFVGLITLVPIYIFSSRLEQMDGRVDRLDFFNIFLAEVSSWSAWNWLFGTVPITPLSAQGCAAMSYWQNLFSSAGDGSCYVVILHSFIMRVIFDAGIFGLLLSVLVPLCLMRRAGVDWIVTLALISISVANGASVSGINNPYVAIPIIIAVLVAGNQALFERGDGADESVVSAAKRWI